METIDGVKFLRQGRQWTVHKRAYEFYRGRLRGLFDVVIDEINTMPFFTPIWSDIPTFGMIWQLAREVWWYESPFPVNMAGYLMEPMYLQAYRHTPILTFSESTRTDLRRLGFSAKITMVPPGIEVFPETGIAKTSPPSFVYVGRLAPSKRVHEIVEAFALFHKEQGHGRLLLVGTGPAKYEQSLDRLTSQLGIGDFVERCGWLQGAEKRRRMGEAHLLLMASAREGWGLVVTESNACGTPAVVYDVPGLRDSVRHLETGLVVAPTPRSLADGMIRLINDRELYSRLQGAARTWSKIFTYDAGFQVVQEAISTALVH